MEELDFDLYERAMLAHEGSLAVYRHLAGNQAGIVLEVGAGTGLLSKALDMRSEIDILVLVELSARYCAELNTRFPRALVREADAITYRHEAEVDSVVQAFTYHHIADEFKDEHCRAMYSNLRPGGHVWIGDVFLLPYQDEAGRDQSLGVFHQWRLSGLSGDLYDLELATLEAGLARSGEWKTSAEVLVRSLERAGFTGIQSADIGSQHCGGYRVLCGQKPR